jgi:cell division protein FtsQ
MIKKLIVIFQFLVICTLFVSLLSFTLKSENLESQALNLIKIESLQNRFVSVDNVVDILSKEGLVYENQEVFDIKSIESVIMSQPQIKEAEVFLNLNGLVDVIVEEKKPILRVFESSDSYYLDEDCQIMPLSDLYTSRNLIASGDLNSFNTEDICKLSKYIESDKFLKSLISQIYFEKNNIILVTRIQNHEINIGDLDFIELKFDNLLCFYNNVIDFKGWNYYKSINLKYTDQIICSKK